ncbi:MAG: hypothetical protein QME68_04040 [Elusimicrobiota bacterium]|nr:hypothetical protein [Elusimicrobiota bacterium]
MNLSNIFIYSLGMCIGTLSNAVFIIPPDQPASYAFFIWSYPSVDGEAESKNGDAIFRPKKSVSNGTGVLLYPGSIKILFVAFSNSSFFSPII